MIPGTREASAHQLSGRASDDEHGLRQGCKTRLSQQRPIHSCPRGTRLCELARQADPSPVSLETWSQTESLVSLDFGKFSRYHSFCCCLSPKPEPGPGVWIEVETAGLG